MNGGREGWRNVNGWMDACWMIGYIDGWMDGLKDGWMN